MLQAVQEVLPGRDGDGDVGGRLRAAGAHVAGRVGPVRAGRDRGLVLDTAGRGGPVAQGDAVHRRVRGAVPVDRRVLRAHILHRAQDGAQVARGHRDRGQRVAQHHDDGRGGPAARGRGGGGGGRAARGRRGRHGRRLLHRAQDGPVQGAGDIHRLGHRVEHGHRGHVFHHRLGRDQGPPAAAAALPVAARRGRQRQPGRRPRRPRRRSRPVQLVRARRRRQQLLLQEQRRLLARVLRVDPQQVQQAARPFAVVRPERHHHAGRVRGKCAPSGRGDRYRDIGSCKRFVTTARYPSRMNQCVEMSDKRLTERRCREGP